MMNSVDQCGQNPWKTLWLSIACKFQIHKYILAFYLFYYQHHRLAVTCEHTQTEWINSWGVFTHSFEKSEINFQAGLLSLVMPQILPVCPCKLEAPNTVGYRYITPIFTS